MVSGSTAGILYGEPRMTHDVDIVVALAMRDIHAFVEAFPLEEFDCPPKTSWRSRFAEASVGTAT